MKNCGGEYVNTAIGVLAIFDAVMTSGYIASGTQQLHYLQWGGGKKLLVCFHGYSNNAGLFASLAHEVRQEYTTISFDLPYHGKSNWKDENPWRKRDLIEMVKALMAKNQVSKISLACFSIGGRICLTLAEYMPEVIDSMILIAPDGLVPNKFYKFVTTNVAGKKIFHHFLNKPDKYISFINWLEERKIIDASRRKFVDRYVGMPSARDFLKKVWPNLQRIVPDQRKVKRNIDQYSIPTHLFMGRHDYVIPLKHGEIFANGTEHIRLHILEKGHRVMDDESIKDIAKYLHS